jgi:hypothetical protein
VQREVPFGVRATPAVLGEPALPEPVGGAFQLAGAAEVDGGDAQRTRCRQDDQVDPVGVVSDVGCEVLVGEERECMGGEAPRGVGKCARVSGGEDVDRVSAGEDGLGHG